MPDIIQKGSIALELAQKMVEAAARKAREIGVPQVIAVLDEGGTLKAFCRMDGAALISVEIAQNKAFTALFGFPTSDFFEFIKGDQSLLFGLPQLPRVAAYGGGFPIRINGSVVGAIGVSGGTVQNDIDCAEAALELIKK